MNQTKSLKQALTDKLKYFCQHSTLHGLIYFYGHHHWTVYVTWSLILALNIVLWVFLSNMIWTKFTVDPTFTVVESSRYPTSNIPFPSVILCDPEVVYGPNTKDITYILKLRGFEARQIAAFYDSFSEIQQSNYTVNPIVLKMHGILHDLGFTHMRLLRILSKPCDVLLVRCQWRYQIRDCKEMFRQILTHKGFCCQFDIPYFKAHASDIQTSFMSGVQITEALDIIVNGQSVATDGSRYDGHVSIYILDEEHHLSLIDNFITVTPAGIFDINLYVWAIDSAPEVKALQLAYRNCLLDSDPTPWARYYQGCLSQMLLQQVVNYCRCLPFNVTSQELHVDDFPNCTWDRLKCVYDTTRKVEREISDLGIRGNCLVKCDYVQYDTETEYVKQDQYSIGINETNSHVFVHFTADSCMKYRREVLYTWDQMLANLGGIFGLCLGGSVISILELLWFIFDLIFAVLPAVPRRTTKRVPKKANKIFTLTEKDFGNKVFVKKNKKLKVVGNFPFVH